MEYYSAMKKEWSTDTCYIVDKSWKHDAKLMKPAIKYHIVYAFINMKYPEQANP